MRTPEKRRMPGAFRLDHPAVEAVEELRRSKSSSRSQADAHQAVEAIVHPPRRGIRWGALALSTGGAIVVARASASPSMRWCATSSPAPTGSAGSALALIALFVAGAAGAGRARGARAVPPEAAGAAPARLRRRRGRATTATRRSRRSAPCSPSMRGRPDTAMARRRVAAHLGEIIDGRDLLVLAERDLIAPLDARAKALASAAARRVSVVTAVSPRAFFDVAFVLWESVRLIRRIAAIYGGRPGTLGLFRLMKAVVSHLAVTGSIAVGDTLLAAVRRPRPCRPALRQARRRRGERADDGADRAFRHGRLPPAALPERRSGRGSRTSPATC